MKKIALLMGLALIAANLSASSTSAHSSPSKNPAPPKNSSPSKHSPPADHSAPADHSSAPAHSSSENVEGVSSDEAIKKLLEGNRRFSTGKPTNPDHTLDRVKEIAKGQHPFAVVITCSDSRLAPEVLFDQGMGDIFVIRTAGNVVDEIGLGSIEYAVEHLGSKLVVVLGHERCGAVDATVKGGEIPGHIARVADAIRPAVEYVKWKKGDAVDNAVRANIEMIVGQLKGADPFLKDLAEKNEIKIIGAYYDIDNATVEQITK